LEGMFRDDGQVDIGLNDNYTMSTLPLTFGYHVNLVGPIQEFRTQKKALAVIEDIK
jgi:hypothetical protein